MADGENLQQSEHEGNESLDSRKVTPFELAHRHYDHLWSQTMEDIASLLKLEPTVEQPQATEERPLAIRRTSMLYLQYVKACNGLVECFENTAHAQKRAFLRGLSKACIGRVVELKAELVAIENSEFHFLDQLLLDLKMSPRHMEVRPPTYFRDRSSDERKRLKEVLEQCLRKVRDLEPGAEVVSRKEKYVRTAMVYLRMIQSHERARQDRESFGKQQRRSVGRQLQKRKEAARGRESAMSGEEAAVAIQKAWRYFLFRKRLKQERTKEMEFLHRKIQTVDVRADIDKDRVRITERNEKEYLTVRDQVKQEMWLNRAPTMMERLKDDIRDYFHHYKEVFLKFPVFPEEVKGGSVTLLATKIVVQLETEEDPKDKKSGKKDKKSSKKEDKKGKKKEEEVVVYTLKPSKYTPNIQKLVEEYRLVWEGKEYESFDRFDSDLLEKEVEREVSEEVRLLVDEKMRVELTRLTDALQKDKKKKGKKGKGKKGKKKGKKKEKDLTPDRTTESLIEELVENGIIVDYPRRSLDDFFGECNYSGSLQHLSCDPESEPLPCLGDVRRVVVECCVLPMGSETVHSTGPFVKSLFIAGPKGSGKKTLVHGVCTALDAVLMDLSSANLQGKYSSEEGGVAMLSHLVLKVGRLLQPTVLHIGEADSYFWKKKPKGCPIANPARFTKELRKLLKKVKGPDRLLVVGTSVRPFDAKLKALRQCFEKIVCVFRPDFGCRRQLWLEFVRKFGGEVTSELDLSVLSGVSEGFTAANIESTVRQVLTSHRLAGQDSFPLRAGDFMSCLAGEVPVYGEEHDTYTGWLNGTPMAKKRLAQFHIAQAGEEGEEEEEDAESSDDDY